MKTQISRESFRPGSRYSGVFQQMGRMLTDADWNELATIDRTRLAAALADVIGSGIPRERGLLRVTPGAGGAMEYALRWGQVYVDGIPAQVCPDPLAEGVDAEEFALDAQADFPLAPVPEGDHRLYLDVWERTVTAQEDSALLDPGLHGADTCTRTQTMAQVKWCDPALDPEDEELNPPVGTALLSLMVREGSTAADPCDPCADELALQDEVANHLFRVEVHDVTEDAAGQPVRVVLKWSGENGAEQYAVSALPTGFAGSQWVFEFHHGPDQGMAADKHLGRHLAAGFVPARGTLVAGYPEVVPAGLSLVRRWDGYCELEKTGSEWRLAGGVDHDAPLATDSDPDAHGHVVAGASVEFQLERLVLTLELADHALLAGDFWWVAVRGAVHAPGDELAADLPPVGVHHHYLCLGDVVDGVLRPCDSDLCAPVFPALTDLRADDVCFENDSCQLPGVRTVQDALDQLCQQQDLPWHNRHLHGWGIVCGLMLECGEQLEREHEGQCAGGRMEEFDPERLVRLTPGYALDCEGQDLVLDRGCGIDLVAAIEDYDKAHDSSLLNDGSGTVCLRLDGIEDGRAIVGVEPYSREKFQWSALLQGTLWMDFYQDCVVDLIAALSDEMRFLDEEERARAEGGKDALVSAARRKYTSVLNLIIQLVNTENGSRVWLSEREHLILLDFYRHLQSLLASKTFCAMFEEDEFPAYPFPKMKKTTWFGKGLHTRVLHHPKRPRVYTWGGADRTIHVYDTDQGELVEVVEMPAPKGAEVKALCCSPDGRLLYAAAHVQGLDTLLGIAQIGDDTHRWLGSSVLCDLLLMNLEADAGSADLVYATGLGKGLYFLHPQVLLEATEKQRPQPMYAFFATGPLRMVGAMAYATAASKEGESERYDAIVALDLSATESGQAPTQTVRLQVSDGVYVSGTDDLAVAGTLRSGYLYVVADEVDGDGKQVLFYRLGKKLSSLPETTLSLGTDSAVALEYDAAGQELLAVLEEQYCLLRIDAAGEQVMFPPVPVQIAPLDLAIDPQGERVFVLDHLSNTITAIPQKELPATVGEVNELIAYRNAVLEAFFGLAGGVLQYLKDCFCHHLLVRCPQCEEEDVLYLGIVEMRDQRVHQVCNFEKRKYVHSFPTVEYWLSLVPVLPLARELVQQLCRSLMPDLFPDGLPDAYQGTPIREESPSLTHVTNRVQSKSARRYARSYQRLDPGMTLRQQRQGLGFLGTATLDGLVGLTAGSGQAGVSKQSLIGTTVTDATRELENQRVGVDKVVEYDPDQAFDSVRLYTSTPQRIEPGSKVTLYQQNGKVLFYGVETARTSVAGGDLEQVETLQAQVAQINSEVASLEERRTSVQSDLQALQQQLQDMETMRVSLKLALDAERSVTSIDGVSDEIAVQLRERNVLTVAELASADAKTLAQQTGLTQAQTKKIIASAQARLGR